MSDHESAIDPETLLEHMEWVRDLAERLVGDPGLADDLRQKTWLATVGRPAPRRGALRGWLAAVVRNLARQEQRAEHRRARRERLASRPEAVDATDQLFERVQFERNVVTCVLELHEPYRSALLMRYREQLEVPQIAERLGVPVATIHTRLRRGLAMVRARLGVDGGHGRTFGLVLAALDRWRAAPGQARSAAIAGGVVLAGGVVAALWLAGGSAARAVPAGPHGVPRGAPSAALESPPRARGSAPIADAVELEPGPPPPAAAWVAPVHGRVFDLDFAPVPRIRVSFVPDLGGGPAPAGQTDADGRFELMNPAERGHFTVDDPAWTPVMTAELFPGDGSGAATVLAAPRAALTGRVVDSQGQPVAAAHVHFGFQRDFTRDAPVVLRRSAFGRWETWSDDDGRFWFDAVPVDRSAGLRVRAVGYRETRRELEPMPSEVTIELAPDRAPDVVSGSVVDTSGAPVPGVWVGAGERATRSDPLGRFALAVDEAATVELVAATRGRLGRARGDASAPLEIVLAESAAPLVGYVLDAHGAARAGVRVRLSGGTPFGRIGRRLQGSSSDEPVTVEALLAEDPFHPWTETDAEGRFELPVLDGGSYRLVATDVVTLERTASDPVAADHSPVELVLDEAAPTPVLVRVVGLDESPILGAYVSPFRPPILMDSAAVRDYGPRLVTDADGRAEWPALASVPLQFHVHAPAGYFHADYAPYARGPSGAVRLYLAREAALRVVLQGETRADRFRVLDETGRAVPLATGNGTSSSFFLEGELSADGTSQTYGVPESGTTLVLTQNGDEVLRVPLELVPGSLTVLEL